MKLSSVRDEFAYSLRKSVSPQIRTVRQRHPLGKQRYDSKPLVRRRLKTLAGSRGEKIATVLHAIREGVDSAGIKRYGDQTADSSWRFGLRRYEPPPRYMPLPFG